LSINDRISKLRGLMKEKGITAYIIPSSDPHQSEYVADHYNSRAWISGFTGSAGTVVVTNDKAILWTDGRYFIQAEEELKDSEYELFKLGVEGFPSYMEWLRDNLGSGDTIGFDGKVLSQFVVENLEKKIQDKNIQFISEYDLVGEIWEDRPNIPKEETFIHELKYTGLSAEEKIGKVREEMKKKDADYFLIAGLDDIAWLYNIRGGDVPQNPVIISYGLVSMDKAYLFVNKSKINKEVEEYLIENRVNIEDYDKIAEIVFNIGEDNTLILNKRKINRWLYNSIPKGCKIVNEIDITTKLKAVKNETEIENQRNAYIKDGVALTKFLYWLDNNVDKEKITEISAEEKLNGLRSEQDGFVDISFSTISAYGPNAAMAHYSATEESNAVLKPKGFYLVDSGGQYLDGTTDITRTMALGPITDEEKKDFTLTLKGHINLIDTKFLEGTNGYQLDVICRYPLWQEGLDYKHGTGHGIGFLLNVHEGPHNIAAAPNNIELEKGMVVSIEPGVYKAGKHGIRIENIVVVDKDIETESGQFMKFETLSFTPIDLDSIDVSLLTEREKEWLNNYHQEVYHKLSSYLSEEEQNWLKDKTKSI